VHMKSKSMQKVSKENSLVEKYKKALRIYAIVFAIVFLLLFITAFNLAVAWTAMYMISLLVIIPIGAANLVQLLTGDKPESENCCAVLCHFIKTAVPFACCNKVSKQRSHAYQNLPGGPQGKFAMSRLKMADMVEKTAVLIWFSLVCYLFAAFSMVASNAQTQTMGPDAHGGLIVSHFAGFFVFMALEFALRRMLVYCKYTLRDILDDSRKQSGRKVSAGMSVNSSTATTDASDSDSL